MRTIDLFSGCGGMSLGFQNAGFDVVAAFDNWEPAVNIYSKNFTHPIYKADLNEDAPVDQIEELQPDIIIGGPPCQDFSIAGHRNMGERANLTIRYAEIISRLKPKWFVMENVYNIERMVLPQEFLTQVTAAYRRHECAFSWWDISEIKTIFSENYLMVDNPKSR